MNLDNKVIAITGGAQGLGLAMARAIGERGGKIALIDINPEVLDKAVDALDKTGIEAVAHRADITDEARVVEVFKDIVKHWGQLDGLINNAGITRDGLLIKAKDGELTKMPFHQWRGVIDTNLTGTFLCGREAAYQMIQKGEGGVIINISSLSRAGNYGQTNYSAAKAGVAAMAVTWAKELARYGIRCAAIAPGFIETEMTGAMLPEIIESITAHIPLGRMGQPDEIAQAAISIFENDYYNGRVFEVDGGLRI